MPGLIGFTTTPASMTPAEHAGMLDRMRRAVTHREWLVADDAFADARVYATRVDTRLLQPDPQPHTLDDIYVWIDGECSRDGSDADLLARRYRELGDFSFLRDVDGFFAAVVYDAGAGTVHLVSDRHGLRQLFWTTAGGRLWWGTELKAALELPGAVPQPDPDVVAHYLEHGFLPGDSSWFPGVTLVPPGSVVTFDIAAGSTHTDTYWSWDDLPVIDLPRARGELLGEWGRLFREAVARRCRTGRVGVLLSGGLDSRAILGAVPDTIAPLHAVTFGRPDSPDVRIAARAAAARGAVHHVQSLSEDNWLAPRFQGIWWADGQTSLIDIHGIGGYDERREWFDINLSGFLGDVTMGGSYLRKGLDEIDGIRTRGRRFIAMGLKMQTSYFDNRIPFFDNALLEFTLNIPREMRAGKHIYADMLVACFPALFRSIPWQETGVPVTWPHPLARAVKRARSALSKLGVGPRERSYGNYNEWLRNEPARTVAGRILTAQDALYPEFVSREDVERQWERLTGGGDAAPVVSRYLTLEIWLQQTQNGRWRDAPPGTVTT